MTEQELKCLSINSLLENQNGYIYQVDTKNPDGSFGLTIIYQPENSFTDSVGTQFRSASLTVCALLYNPLCKYCLQSDIQKVNFLLGLCETCNSEKGNENAKTK